MRQLTVLLFLLAATGLPASLTAIEAGDHESTKPLTVESAQWTGERTIEAVFPQGCVEKPEILAPWTMSFQLHRLANVSQVASGAIGFEVVPIDVAIVLFSEGEEGEFCFRVAEISVRGPGSPPKGEYRLLVTGILETEALPIKPAMVTVAPRSLKLTFDHLDPTSIEAFSPVCAVHSGATDCQVLPRESNVVVKADLPDGVSQSYDVISVRQLGQSGPYLLQVNVDPPLRAGANVTVTAPNALGGAISGSKKVVFPVPKTKKDSVLFVQATAEAGKGQKPNLQVELAVKRPDLVTLGPSTTLGLLVDLEISSRDATDTNKLRLSYPITQTWTYRGSRPGRVGAVYGRFIPRFEAEDGFATNNVLAELSAELVDLALVGLVGETAQKNPWEYSIIPTLGYQWGENLGLDDAKLREFEGYEVSRATAELALTLKRELPQPQNLSSVGFSLTYSGWHRFSEELDTFTDSSGEEAVRLQDGYVDFWEAAIELGLGGGFGVIAKLQTGERPVLFKDEDKVSLGITFKN